MGNLVEVRNLQKWFWSRGTLFGHKEAVRAVDGITFSIRKGEVLSLVG